MPRRCLEVPGGWVVGGGGGGVESKFSVQFKPKLRISDRTPNLVYSLIMTIKAILTKQIAFKLSNDSLNL